MDTAWLLLGVALLTGRWWWVLFSQLLGDLADYGSPEGGAGPQSVLREALRVDRSEALRETPLNRRLAFRGVQRRAATRRRWEAGFGRRGL